MTAALLVASTPPSDAACSGRDLLSEVNAAVTQVAAQYDTARLATIGRSVENRPIRTITIVPDLRASDDDRVRVLVISGQHGNEPTPVRAAVECIESLAADTHNLQGAFVTFVPVVNPDGLAVGRRSNAAGADLNRNWICADQPETAAVTRLVRAVRPHILIDLHEWTSSEVAGPDCVEVAGTGGGANARLARAIADEAFRRTAASGLGLAPIRHSTKADPCLAHRKFTSDGICCMLVETNPRHAMPARRRAYNDLIGSVLEEIARPSDPRTGACVAKLLRERPIDGRWMASLRPDVPEKRHPDTRCRACWIAMIALAVWIIGILAAPGRHSTSARSSIGCGGKTRSAAELDATRRGMPLGTRLVMLRNRRHSSGESGKRGLALILSK